MTTKTATLGFAPETLALDYQPVEDHQNALSADGASSSKAKPCCHVCGSGREIRGQKLLTCPDCGTSYHPHDCGNKYKQKGLPGAGTCPRCNGGCLCATLAGASQKTALKHVLGSTTALAEFRKEHECKGIECQAYTRRVRKLEHYLGRLKKLKRLAPSARHAALAQQRHSGHQTLDLACTAGPFGSSRYEQANNASASGPTLNGNGHAFIKQEPPQDNHHAAAGVYAHGASLPPSNGQRNISIASACPTSPIVVSPNSEAKIKGTDSSQSKSISDNDMGVLGHPQASDMKAAEGKRKDGSSENSGHRHGSPAGSGGSNSRAANSVMETAGSVRVDDQTARACETDLPSLKENGQADGGTNVYSGLEAGSNNNSRGVSDDDSGLQTEGLMVDGMPSEEDIMKLFHEAAGSNGAPGGRTTLEPTCNADSGGLMGDEGTGLYEDTELWALLLNGDQKLSSLEDDSECGLVAAASIDTPRLDEGEPSSSIYSLVNAQNPTAGCELPELHEESTPMHLQQSTLHEHLNLDGNLAVWDGNELSAPATGSNPALKAKEEAARQARMKRRRKRMEQGYGFGMIGRSFKIRLTVRNTMAAMLLAPVGMLGMAAFIWQAPEHVSVEVRSRMLLPIVGTSTNAATVHYPSQQTIRYVLLLGISGGLALTAALAMCLLMRYNRVRHQQALPSHNTGPIQIVCSESKPVDMDPSHA